MIALENPGLISIADYLSAEESGPGKHEYLGGVVHAMAGGSNRHNSIAGNCFGRLFGELRGKSCQPFNSDTKVRIEFPDHTRFYYPDAMVVCDSNSGTDHFQERPVVIVEVLSESTRRVDLGEKRDAYLTIPSLKVLLLIEPESPSLILYRRRPAGGFAIEHHSGADAAIPLPEIEATLALAELYDRVPL